MQNLTTTIGRFRLKHLHLMDILARTGSMHSAAKELSSSQPAASKLLQDLEDILGVSLFSRSARGTAPNDFGQYVLAYSRRVLNETKRFNEAIENMKSGGFGTLSVGAILDPSSVLLAKAVAALVAQRPLIQIKIEEGSSVQLIEALSRNQHDLVIARYTNAKQVHDFDMIPLQEEPLVIFVSRNHPLAGRASIDMEELLHYPWVVSPENTPTRLAFERAFGELRLRVPVVVDTGSFVITLHLMNVMNAISVLPRDIIADRLSDASYCALPIQVEITLPPFGIMTRKDTDLSDNASLFVNLIRELNDAQKGTLSGASSRKNS